jgi:hypothetical protein
VTDFDSKTEFLANWFKRSVVVVLPVNSTAGLFLNFIATFSPSIGMKKGVEVGGGKKNWYQYGRSVLDDEITTRASNGL